MWIRLETGHQGQFAKGRLCCQFLSHDWASQSGGKGGDTCAGADQSKRHPVPQNMRS